MTEITIKKYELPEIIELYRLHKHNLSDEKIKIVNDIVSMVTSPNYNKTPNFKKGDKYEKNNKRHKKDISEEDWQEFRKFKSTEICEKKDSIQLYRDSIQTSLNKITKENSKTISLNILENFNNIIVEITNKNDNNHEDETLKEMNHVHESIVNIVKTNSFYSYEYAELYGNFIEKYDKFDEIIKNEIEEFTKNMFNICSDVDESDYEKFCEVNKENDNRRSVIIFYISLANKEIIDNSIIKNIIEQYFERFQQLKTDKKNKIVIEEISEILNITIRNSQELLEDDEVWENYRETVKEISEISNLSEHPGLSNKIIFKFMDLIEEIY